MSVPYALAQESPVQRQLQPTGSQYNKSQESGVAHLFVETNRGTGLNRDGDSDGQLKHVYF